MKGGVYFRLAAEGIRKNKQLYAPYLLTCTLMVTVYFIIASLAISPAIETMSGVSATRIILDLGRIVIGAFSMIFLFYTHSFLTRRRQKEFGLYNVLGMSKWNIARILLWETLLSFLVSFLSGTAVGLLLYKLAETVLLRMVNGSVSFTLSVMWEVIPQSLLFFGAIFLVQFIASLWQLRLSNPVALLHSEKAGEKPPKANLRLGLLGVMLLAAAYYMAVIIEEPLAALFFFFAAVLLVIIATYLIFIAGSVTLCRMLQKNKRYYYRSRHFVSVSSMAYRMKRNGASLASICILATMVLVMISSSGSLYLGEKDIIRTHYPKAFCVSVSTEERITTETENAVRAAVQSRAQDYGVPVLAEQEYRYLCSPALLDGTHLLLQEQSMSDSTPWEASKVGQVYLLDISDYAALTGDMQMLTGDEVLFGSVQHVEPPSELTLDTFGTYRVRRMIDPPFRSADASTSVMSTYYVVVPELTRFFALADEEDCEYSWTYRFDTDADDASQVALSRSLGGMVGAAVERVQGGSYRYRIDGRTEAEQDFFGMYGGLFFIGILLSAVLLCATVLIIYFKQISEGYEDASRFEIMQKVGMTKEDIRRSVNSQMLTVFFLPLLLALLHVLFAFPMIRRLLTLFGMVNGMLYALATLGCFIVFALFYTVVYRATSNVYYKIVA